MRIGNYRCIWLEAFYKNGADAFAFCDEEEFISIGGTQIFMSVEMFLGICGNEHDPRARELFSLIDSPGWPALQEGVRLVMGQGGEESK